jgi:RNA polymerase sigma-70 factor (ECF subfamily)
MIGQNVMQAAGTSEGTRALGRLSEAEFDSFYKRNGRPLMRYIARLCGDAALAEDLFQKTFYLFVRTSLPTTDEEQMRPYLYRIATNVVHDHWRKAKHESREPLDETHADPTAHMGTVDLRHDLQKTFGLLTPNERALLWFAHVEGYDHREVAQHVGVKEKSVRVLLHRARRKLATMLQQLGFDHEVTS